MFRDVLSAAEGIGLVPILALLLFFALFVGMLVWVVRLNRTYLDSMGQLPLDDDNEPLPSDHPLNRNPE